MNKGCGNSFDHAETNKSFGREAAPRVVNSIRGLRLNYCRVNSGFCDESEMCIETDEQNA